MLHNNTSGYFIAWGRGVSAVCNEISMPGVVSILSSTCFLALALNYCNIHPDCPPHSTTTPAIMMISVLHDPANGGSLSINSSTPRPTLRDGEFLLKVKAAGVNRLDLLQAVGKYPPPPGDSEILGVEVSGVVEEISDKITAESDLKKGDAVMALVGGGGYAEYAAVPYQTAVKIPNGVTFPEAAGLMEVYLTAYQALTWNGHLKDNETILIHAGASGVGLAASQLCKALFKNVTVITTSGSEEKVEVCKENSANISINYRKHNFAEEVLTSTKNRGADVIIDFIGASYWENHTQCVAQDGRIVLLGLLGGAITEGPLNLGVLLKKRISLICSTLRTRSLDYKHRLILEFTERCLPLFGERGLLKVPIHQVYPLDQASLAHTTMRENKNIGKLILKLL